VDVEKTWRWRFLGYESDDEARPVQIWYDSLSPEARDEIRDLCQWLQVVTDKQWREPGFKDLPGAGGISEIRPDDIRTQDGNFTYRVYGYFGPDEHEYTLLHGTLKLERNDRNGKRIARERLGRLKRKEARTHEFNF